MASILGTLRNGNSTEQKVTSVPMFLVISNGNAYTYFAEKYAIEALMQGDEVFMAVAGQGTLNYVPYLG